VLGSPSVATVTIAHTVSATVYATIPNANEVGPINGEFTVYLSGPAAVSTIVSYTLSGTATNGTQYTIASNSVTFAAGETSEIVPVVVLNDGIADGDQTVILTLTSTSEATAVVDTPSVATVTITSIAPSFATINATVPNASEVGPVDGQFCIYLSSAASSLVTVTFLVDGTATSDINYEALPSNVTFSIGSSSQCIDVNVLSTFCVGSRNITITLNSTTDGNVAVGSPDFAVITIACPPAQTTPPACLAGVQCPARSVKLRCGPAFQDWLNNGGFAVYDCSSGTLGYRSLQPFCGDDHFASPVLTSAAFYLENQIRGRGSVQTLELGSATFATADGSCTCDYRLRVIVECTLGLDGSTPIQIMNITQYQPWDSNSHFPVGPYTYEWSNGATTSSTSGPYAAYSLTVYDSSQRLGLACIAPQCGGTVSNRK